MPDREAPLPSVSAVFARQGLSGKIVAALIGFLLLALVAIGATLWLSWQLEGAAAAINETGSLRRHSYRLALQLTRAPEGANAEIERQIGVIDATMSLVKRGDPQRPLGLPPTPTIRAAFSTVEQHWIGRTRPLARQVQAAAGAQRAQALARFDAHIEELVVDIDRLVGLIERDNELRTFWLRVSQLALVAMAIGGTVALMNLMFILIVEPVLRLREGMRSMAESDFGVRLAVDRSDEFGQLAEGFNEMADRLQRLYGSLDEEVRLKTANLEDKNRELALLYDCAAFLQLRHALDDTCAGFLERIAAYFGADGGTVRLIDPNNGNVHMVAHEGLPVQLTEAERCLKPGACLCGEAAVKKISVVHKLSELPAGAALGCAREGYATVSVFQIAAQQQLGLLTLHFRANRTFLPREEALLGTLARLLGVAIENMRLAAREREMAISEERNLVARDLHDSIAQGLNFLNLQVQMLDESLRAGKTGDAAAIVPALRAGVKESYEDVRELLLNFRSRLEEDDLNAALRKTARKFADQTGIDTHCAIAGNGGAPISREAQLQVLFIAQEALSNIRKHARADRVDVQVADDGDFVLTISDNGIGFDPGGRGGDESHVGLHIMRERAVRVGAKLEVVSRPGEGTTVTLRIGQAQRRAA